MIEATTLKHVVWELTLACDLACGHCGSRAGAPREGELDTREALAVVDQLAEMGAREVSLIGGEAYLRDDWDVIARAIADHGMLCSMVTGGRGLSRAIADRAAAARVSSVSISIDGLRATHDAQRGVEGSFDRAVLAMTHLREAGVPFSANSQVNRLSFADLGAMLELFIEHGCHGWQIAMTVPMGRATERPEWLLQPHDLPIVFDELARLAVRGREGGVILYPGNNVGYFGPHEDTLRGHLSKETEGSYYQGCSAGRAGLGLEADGSVKGCPSLPSAPYTGGNVRRTSIREIWETTTELSFARGERSAELWGFCAGCYYASVCKAGCSWTAHVYFGRRGNNPICHHRALEHQKRGEREVLRRIEDAPGLPFDYGRWTIDKTPAPPTTEPWPVPPLERPKRRLRVV